MPLITTRPFLAPLLGDLYVESNFGTGGGSIYDTEIVQLGSDRVFSFTNYDPSTTTSNMFAKVRLINNLDVNLGTRVTVDAITGSNTGTALLIDTDKVLCLYSDSAIGPHNHKGAVCTISGQTITPGTPVSFGNRGHMRGITIGTDKTLVAYTDNATIRFYAVVISVSGTVPTFNTPVQVINQAVTANTIRLSEMDDGRYAITYSYFLVSSRHVISIVSVSGNTVTVEESYQWTSGNAGASPVYAFENVGNNEFVMLYRRVSDRHLKLRVFKYDPAGNTWATGQEYEVMASDPEPANDQGRARMIKVSNSRVMALWIDNPNQKVHSQLFDIYGVLEPIPSTQFELNDMADAGGNAVSIDWLGGRVYNSWTEGGASTPDDLGKRTRILNPGNPSPVTPESQRYWRIQSTAHLDSGYSISELEFFYDGSWQSLVGKTVINNGSAANPTFPITKVNDGITDPPNANSIFYVQDTAGETMDFIVDLGSAKSVTQVGIYPQTDGTTSVFNRLDNLFVYYGYPGNWTLVNSFTSLGTGWNPTAGRRDFTL